MGREMTARRRALSGYLAANRHRRFRPGQWDCALFVAGWLVALGHEDPRDRIMAPYSRLEDGMTALRTAGFSGLDHWLRFHLDLQAGWMQALPGDIVSIDNPRDPGRTALGIAGDGRAHVLRTGAGFDVITLDSVRAVYRP